MNLFQIKSSPAGNDRMDEFLRDNFVSIGWDEVGELYGSSVEEIGEKLARVYGDQEEDHPLALNAIYLFVHTIKDGDYILVTSNEIVYLGDVGDYYFVEQTDAEVKGLSHRRGVTWLNSIPIADLNAEVHDLIRDSRVVSRFEPPIAAAGLERWAAKLVEPHEESVDKISGANLNPMLQKKSTPASAPDQASKFMPDPSAEAIAHVDSNTIEEALDILKYAMRSNDIERRERAAIAILQYARPI